MRGLICFVAVILPSVAAAADVASDRTRTALTYAIMEARQVWPPRMGRMADLRGLTELTDPMAERLSRQRGWFRLDGLVALTDRQAEALARHRGRVLLGAPNSFTAWQKAVLRSSGNVTLIDKGLYD